MFGQTGSGDVRERGEMAKDFEMAVEVPVIGLEEEAFFVAIGGFGWPAEGVGDSAESVVDFSGVFGGGLLLSQGQGLAAELLGLLKMALEEGDIGKLEQGQDLARRVAGCDSAGEGPLVEVPGGGEISASLAQQAEVVEQGRLGFGLGGLLVKREAALIAVLGLIEVFEEVGDSTEGVEDGGFEAGIMQSVEELAALGEVGFGLVEIVSLQGEAAEPGEGIGLAGEVVVTTVELMAAAV